MAHFIIFGILYQYCDRIVSKENIVRISAKCCNFTYDIQRRFNGYTNIPRMSLGWLNADREFLSFAKTKQDLCKRFYLRKRKCTSSNPNKHTSIYTHVYAPKYINTHLHTHTHHTYTHLHIYTQHHINTDAHIRLHIYTRTHTST